MSAATNRARAVELLNAGVRLAGQADQNIDQAANLSGVPQAECLAFANAQSNLAQTFAQLAAGILALDSTGGA